MHHVYIFTNNKEWGLGIGDWGLGIGPNPQSPIPNPHSFYLETPFCILLNDGFKIKLIILYIIL